MVTYQQRAPRLNLSFPLEFRVDDAPTLGHCLNLSESGLLGVFDVPLDLWTSGELLLQFNETRCWVPARVARSAEHEAGLSFLFRGEREREVVRSLLRQAETGTQLVGRPPF